MFNFFKKCVTVRDSLPRIPLKYSTLFQANLYHPYCHFLKRFWKSFSMGVLVTVLAALMSSVISKNFPCIVILTLEKNRKSYGARPAEYSGCRPAVMFHKPGFSFGCHAAVARTMFLIMSHKHSHKRGLTTSENGKNHGVSVFSNARVCVEGFKYNVSFT